jgi:transketolase
MALGAYVARNSAEEPQTVVVASGSEVALALEAVALLEKEGACSDIRVVSMPCREAFLAAPAPVREAILPKGARVVVVEAGVAQGWERLARFEDILSLERFGESGPAEEVARHLGFTASGLAARIRG